ncbi:pyridoxamine 5'-phosphate oxidase family protein [Nocardia puris]|uniref:Pyridoxamine 5'-phosphate oxidase N-terminal domain-containing protein n=1 Tax=Nocardia puris TaxID=208602 RepID=A0A366E2E5_9NOCA|nr:pyridoxamine 5'-phosphate oxidase family protein [Nocardia puris]RBO96546.1 hypothetical protein DFR74_101561 [Nocardia puris]
MTPFHAGELAVQRRMAQADIAVKVARTIRTGVPPVAAEFLAAQPMVVLGAADGAGRLWASQLTGPSGFVRTTGEDALAVDARPADGDPLAEVLAGPAPVGMIALEPRRRRRMRVNGHAVPDGTGLLITTDQVYSNCPKYISRREIEDYRPGESSPVARGTELDAAQRAAVAAADTFFIASADEDGNADASHRGGNPGFLQVLSPTELRWPDYRGNSLFMTLGNLAVRPECGLLIPDWTTGGALQLTGTAEIRWETGLFTAGAQCVVDFTVTGVAAVATGPLRWGPPELSPVNP